ncbi:allantoinase [Sporolactobacillus spathodeae]|uniref:Allantoinase n=1 Tax=Sporolactobacillus spathodeae TaxID=1465502 RepID=A0ABS2Q8X1_9BACL|nr:allantoinase [Sporolactobacillus spathodeae]MBM7658225.1 allantoinase [Sporolactobacillus spathodeae]
MAYDLLIKDGNVVLPDGVRKIDIGISKGRIAAIGDSLNEPSASILHAEGLTIFPGAIDVHVHFDEPGRTEWEGFETGSSMLAAGGCTSYFDMPLNGIPSTVSRQALTDKVKIAEAESHVDFALWGGLVPGNISDLAEMHEAGAIGFKAFLSPSGNAEFEAVDDLSLLAGMRQIASLGAILALHAESAPIVTFLQKEKEEKGLTGFNDYLASRPIVAEVEAVSRALLFARLTGCKLHFVHISSTEAVALIQQAKAQGQDVTLETCAHYLLYSHEDFCRLGVIGKCAPPLRPETERVNLVHALIDGKIDMVSSDHSPCTWEEKDKDNLFAAWGGISGGQFTLLIVIELALSYHLPLSRVAEWTAASPARRFQLAPEKGGIQIEADADLVLVDLNAPYTVSSEKLFQKNKFTLYKGHTFPASVRTTISRGRVVYTDGEIMGRTEGQWLRPHGIIAAH